MTKREAKAQRAAWRLALNEGRVVAYPNLLRFQSYATAAIAAEAVRHATMAGIRAHIAAAELTA